MNAELLAAAFCLALFVGPGLLALLGWLLRRSYAAAGGRGRAAMPSLQGAGATTGSAGARFDRSVEQATDRLLRDYPGGLQRAEARELAGRLAQAPEVVEAALSGLADRVPHRLRVTAGGALLYDVLPEDLARLRRRRRLGGPARGAFFALSLLANLGAVWPLIATLAITGVAASMLSYDNWPSVMLSAIGAVLGLALLTWLLERAVRVTLSKGSSLRLAPHGDGEHGDRSARLRARIADALPDSLGAELTELLFRPRALLIIVFLLLAFSSFAGLVAWVAGIWRVAKGAKQESAESPADWVARAEPLGPLASLIPGNDISIQLVRSVLRFLRRRPLTDPKLAERLQRRARASGGRVALCEIVLHEGLEPDEAARVGATLSAGHGGDILVTEEGEVDFQWPEVAVEGKEEGKGKKAKRKKAKERGALEYPGCGTAVPVNLPGLSLGYLQAGLRLISGALVLAFAGLVSVMETPSETGIGLLHGAGFILLILIALGAYLLVGLAGQVARLSAETGLLRDVRRATLQELRSVLEEEGTTLDATALTARLHQTLRGPWPGVGLDVVAREVDWACIDLDLDVSLEASAEAGGATIYDLAPLAERLKGLKQARSEAVSTDRPVGDDLIVFDTAAALG